MHIDEGYYTAKAMNILRTGNIGQEVINLHPYDHPYFGQIFLASIFAIIEYPDSLNPNSEDIWFNNDTIKAMKELGIRILNQDIKCGRFF